jgi:hypothetical protein
MPKIQYIRKEFSRSSTDAIAKANEIMEAYAAQGYDLTLRQLYYQFVSRGFIANRDSEYKRLGSLINDARLAGLIDWGHIVDRTRHMRQNSHWSEPSSIIESAAASYANDKWAGQTYRPEVWIEKDALVVLVQGVCETLDVPYFSCRGYTSQSEMWSAAQRLLAHRKCGQMPCIIHLGDHDPSGKDMTRDIQDRLELFTGDSIEVDRIALNWDQIEQYNPPPNPAKISDTRADAYIAEFGSESWELDALEPAVLSALVERAIEGIRDDKAWSNAVVQEEQGRHLLKSVANNWEAVAKKFRNGSK